ncbi:MAG: hypothetical protein P1V97_19830 [Planctomycetota bacterium]|nr:hypothetical protein [Planctomycetota bacterium]
MSRLTKQLLISASVFLLLCFLSSSVHAQPLDFKTQKGGAFEVFYLDSTPESIQNSLDLCNKSLDKVSERLGIKYSGRLIRVFLTPSDAIFNRQFEIYAGRKPPGWALAVAFPGQRAIIIRSHATRPLTVDNFAMTLRHEIAHILIGQLDRGREKSVPRWLNEGLAMWASGQRLERVQELDLALLAKTDGMPPFSSLEENFPPHAAEVHRAYLQSLSYVLWTEEKMKERKKGIPDFTAELGKGIKLESAFFRVMWIKDPEFEWRYELRNQSSYFEYLFRTVTLFQVLALLAIVAFMRHVWKSWRLKKKLTAEDELEEAIWEANYVPGVDGPYEDGFHEDSAFRDDSYDPGPPER